MPIRRSDAALAAAAEGLRVFLRHTPLFGPDKIRAWWQQWPDARRATSIAQGVAVDTPFQHHLDVFELLTHGLYNQGVVALFSAIIDHAFIVRDFRLERGARSMYVGFASRRLGPDAYERFFEPTDTGLRMAIERAALKAYQAQVAQLAAAVQP